ncbi:hypothetical protein QM996_11475 [Sinorhizobium chiapasense]
MDHRSKIKKEDRKTRRAAERIRRWLDDLRRRQMQAERERRRRWLLVLLLLLLESKPVQSFFLSAGPVPVAPPPPRTENPKRRKRLDEFEERPPFDIAEHIYWDCSTRPGEAHLEVMDGLTWEDIVYLTRIHEPHKLKARTYKEKVPGMPDRYSDEPPHVWTLLDHLREDFLRRDAAAALKTMLPDQDHGWIDACIGELGGWKEIRYCRSRTPDATLWAISRAAARWREERLREEEASKQHAEQAILRLHETQRQNTLSRNDPDAEGEVKMQLP